MHTSLLRDPILCSSRPLFVESSQGASVMWPASSKRARRDVIAQIDSYHLRYAPVPTARYPKAARRRTKHARNPEILRA